MLAGQEYEAHLSVTAQDVRYSWSGNVRLSCIRFLHRKKFTEKTREIAGRLSHIFPPSKMQILLFNSAILLFSVPRVTARTKFPQLGYVEDKSLAGGRRMIFSFYH